jgi:hypothetical protein
LGSTSSTNNNGKAKRGVDASLIKKVENTLKNFELKAGVLNGVSFFATKKHQFEATDKLKAPLSEQQSVQTNLALNPLPEKMDGLDPMSKQTLQDSIDRNWQPGSLQVSKDCESVVHPSRTNSAGAPDTNSNPLIQQTLMPGKATNSSKASSNKS